METTRKTPRAKAPKAGDASAGGDQAAVIRDVRSQLEEQIRRVTETLNVAEERDVLAHENDVLRATRSELENRLSATEARLGEVLREKADQQAQALREKNLLQDHIAVLDEKLAAADTQLQALTTALAPLDAILQAVEACDLGREFDNWGEFAPHQKISSLWGALQQSRDALALNEKQRLALQEANAEARQTIARLTEEGERQRAALSAMKKAQESQKMAHANEMRELIKQHEVETLSLDFKFTRQRQELQQEYTRQIQDMQETHLKQMRQVEKLANLARQQAPEPAVAAPPPAARDVPSQKVSTQLNYYLVESREVFNARSAEYLRIAQERGLSEADKWLLAEAQKLARQRNQTAVRT